MSDFIWVEKYRPKTIDECILPDGIKKTFQDFLQAGEIPNMLLSSHRGLVRQQLQKHYATNLEQTTMSLMDRMKAGFSTLFGTTQRTSHLPSLLQASRNIKSSSSMKQTIPLPMYNSFSERVLRSSPKTAGLSLPVTTKTRLSTHYILGVLLLTSRLIKKTNRQ